MVGDLLDQGASGWRKASYSGGQNSECVEVGETPAGLTAIRDTKDDKRGPVLTVTPAAFDGLISEIKAGNLTFGLI
ncbi:DUF397 domain-containing protein [Kitasatospora sp. MAP5-34]|uniref:DUF397 domain-containing protein n=1 Tax=Kitasatospora sp. MAP5-34 TaxID=3035102 RepID=UPI0024763CBD|nr:DUF397 domain-containing protein [Kitasatospora sp. MAP5-34]MDH6578593.1 hypothetical protein [Kitasatospora sp. MAP5-34]